MQSIGELIKTIVIIIIIRPIFTSFLPNGNIKKYVNFIIGLLIIYMLVAPISNADFRNLWQDMNISVNESNYNKVYENGLIDEYENNLENDVRKKFGVKSIEIEVDENYKIISVDTFGEKEQEIEEYLGI